MRRKRAIYICIILIAFIALFWWYASGCLYVANEDIFRAKVYHEIKIYDNGYTYSYLVRGCPVRVCQIDWERKLACVSVGENRVWIPLSSIELHLFGRPKLYSFVRTVNAATQLLESYDGATIRDVEQGEQVAVVGCAYGGVIVKTDQGYGYIDNYYCGYSEAEFNAPLPFFACQPEEALAIARQALKDTCQLTDSQIDAGYFDEPTYISYLEREGFVRVHFFPENEQTNYLILIGANSRRVIQCILNEGVG